MTIDREDLDLDALEATARAATPGPWEFRTESPSMGGDNYTIRQAGVPGIRMTGYVYGFGTGMIEHIATFDPPTVLALIARLREAEARAENGPCWDEGFTVPVPRGECAPLPPLCTLKAGHLGAHQAGGATWTRRAAGGIERKLREAEAVIEQVRAKLPGPRTFAESMSRDFAGNLWPRNVDADEIAAILATYKPTNQEEP